MKSITKCISLLMLTLLFSSCNGQTKTPTNKGNNITKLNTGGQPKLIKTQGTDQYQNVHCCLQDKAGNLWFGTTGEGVYCYDGKSFSQFTVKDGLSNNKIWSMLEDNTGNIWFGTDSGVSRYNGKIMLKIPISSIDGFNIYPGSSNNKPSESNAVWSILQDKSGKIYFGTDNGIYCYNRQQSSFTEMSSRDIKFTRFLDNDSIINKNNLSLKSVQCMLQDKSGNIWFGSGPMAFEGICLYDGKILTNFKPKDEGWIRNILEDRNGNIWFGTRHYGACRYDGKTFTYFIDKEGIGNPLLQDKVGNIWFGGGEKLNTIESDGGIWCYDGKSYRNFHTKDGLGEYSVWSMIEDKGGNIWVGTRNNGLYRYDGSCFTSFSE